MTLRRLWTIGLLSMAFGLQATTGPLAGVLPHPGDALLTSLAQTRTTPESVAQWLKRGIAFRSDLLLFHRIDYWQSAQELLDRGAGDCEDYAILARDILRRQGRTAFLFSLYGRAGYAHTVCVFVEEGRYNIINQDRLVRSRAPTLEKLAQTICPEWTWGAVAEREGHRGRALRVIRNPRVPA